MPEKSQKCELVDCRKVHGKVRGDIEHESQTNKGGIWR